MTARALTLAALFGLVGSSPDALAWAWTSHPGALAALLGLLALAWAHPSSAPGRARFTHSRGQAPGRRRLS